MSRPHCAPSEAGRVMAGARAMVAIAAMTIAGGLSAETGRQAQAYDAQATYVRTAGPATPSGVSGG